MPDANGKLSPGDPGFGLLNTATKTYQTGPSQVPTTAADQAQQAPVMNYAATPFSVGKNATAQDQLAQITAKESPLMRQAETRANQEKQAKGLLLSSLAVEAGQNAVLSQALPIAQQDAQTYNQAATNTTNAENAAAYQNAQAANTVNLQNATQTNNLINTKLNLSNQMALGTLDANTKTTLASLDNQYRGLLQTSQNASAKFNQIVQNIANISMNNTLDQKAKDSAVASQLNMLNESLRADQEIQASGSAAVQSLNLAQYFNNSGAPATASTPANPASVSNQTAAPPVISAPPVVAPTPAPITPSAPPAASVPPRLRTAQQTQSLLEQGLLRS